MTNPTHASPSREVQKRLLMTIHEDGCYDMLAGLIVINFALIPILDSAGLHPGVRQIMLLCFYGLSIGAILWLKRRVTLPRTGYVQLSRKTTSRISLIMLMVNLVIFLIFAATYLFDLALWTNLTSYQLSVPIGLIFLILLSFTGGLLKAPRFYLYGILVLISFIAFEHLYLKGVVAHHGIPWAGFVSGGILLLIGVLRLGAYKRRYPLMQN